MGSDLLVRDKSREGPTFQKLVVQPLALFVPHFNHAVAKLQRFEDLDISLLSSFLGRRIHGVILDVDDTMTHHHGEIPPIVIDKICDLVVSRVRCLIFSNMVDSPRYDVLRSIGVEVHATPHAKPHPRGFHDAALRMGLRPDEVVMVGDNFLTDGGSIRSGVDFVHVKPIRRYSESFAQRVLRSPQKGSRFFYALVSDAYDALLGRKVWRGVG